LPFVCCGHSCVCRCLVYSYWFDCSFITFAVTGPAFFCGLVCSLPGWYAAPLVVALFTVLQHGSAYAGYIWLYLRFIDFTCYHDAYVRRGSGLPVHCFVAFLVLFYRRGYVVASLLLFKVTRGYARAFCVSVRFHFAHALFVPDAYRWFRMMPFCLLVLGLPRFVVTVGFHTFGGSPLRSIILHFLVPHLVYGSLHWFAFGCSFLSYGFSCTGSSLRRFSHGFWLHTVWFSTAHGFICTRCRRTHERGALARNILAGAVFLTLCTLFHCFNAFTTRHLRCCFVWRCCADACALITMITLHCLLRCLFAHAAVCPRVCRCCCVWVLRLPRQYLRFTTCIQVAFGVLLVGWVYRTPAGTFTFVDLCYRCYAVFTGFTLF